MKITTAFLNPRCSVAVAILLSFALSTVAHGQIIPFVDDFEDGNVADGMPATWLPYIEPALNFASAQFEVFEGDFIITPDNLADVSVAYVDETTAGPDTMGNVSVRTELRYLEVVESATLFARGTADGQSFFAGINGSEVFVGSGPVPGAVPGPDSFLTVDTDLDPFQSVFIQLDVIEIEPDVSAAILVTAWQAGDVMPDEPLLSFEAPMRMGSVGVFVDAHDTEFGSVAFHEFSAALDRNDHPDTPVTGPLCDFNDDGFCQIGDLDALLYDGQTQQILDPYDLNSDGVVNLSDRDEWYTAASAENGVELVPGDTNLDGMVVASDLNDLGTNWQRTDATSVAQGDFNGDGLVAAADLNDIGLFWQHGVAAAADDSAVPEPSGCLALLVSMAVWLVAARHQSKS